MSRPASGDRLRALIFDVDGTLANTERDGHRVAFNHAFRDCGLDWHWSVAAYGRLLSISGSEERLAHFAEREHGGLWKQRGRELSRCILERKRHHYARLLAGGAIRLRPGVLRLLEEAREAGLLLALATTSLRANLQELLARLLPDGGRGWFETAVTGEDVARKKPDPEAYLLALQRLGLTAESVVAIEDSDNGLRAALGAGLVCLITANEYTREQDFSGASLVLEGLGGPGAPFRVLQGEADAERWVTLDLLRRLSAGEHPGAPRG